MSRLAVAVLFLLSFVTVSARSPVLAAAPSSPNVLLGEASTPIAVATAPAAADAAASFALRDGDRVVFYGDSITQNGGYAQFVEQYVRTRYPRWNVRFYNAGVGGDKVTGGWTGPIDARLERDVIALKPSVVTIMLGMNDGGYKPFDPTTLAAFGDGYRAIVAKLRQALPGVRLTFIRSSPFDDVSRPPQFAPGYDDALRRLGCYVATLGATENATVVDFREPVNAGIAAVLKQDPDLARLLVPDRVHPAPAGHVVMGAALLRAWNAPPLVSRVQIDAAAPRVVAAEGTEVTALAAIGAAAPGPGAAAAPGPRGASAPGPGAAAAPGPPAAAAPGPRGAASPAAGLTSVSGAGGASVSLAGGASVSHVGRASVSGAGDGSISGAGNGLSWTQMDRALPLPVSYEDAETDLAQRAGADLDSLDEQRLAVTGLPAGRFELKIDGQRVGTFDHDELAKGVNLARYGTPMRSQAYAVRWSIEGGHERQRVRRDILVAATKDPSLTPVAEAMAAYDETVQKQRSENAVPKPRKYELVPVR